MDTIFAVSSGAPPAAIAVLRISGPGAFGAIEALAGHLPPPRRAGVRALHDPTGDSDIPLDRALVLVFPGPATATGEDLGELHLHGGRAIVRAVEAALARMPGLRRADPGEFTRRALSHGRIDLSEAEGLGDLLMAETEAQRRVAIQSAEGGVRREVERWSAAALTLAAGVEALLDHSDEDDVAGTAQPIERLQTAARDLARAIATRVAQPPVERLRDGLRVVLAGPPNAGKSSLLNRLVEREAAIVSSIAGTTRDRIEASVARDGLALVLTDTAGLVDDTEDCIEAIGVARARESLAAADILLWLGDTPPPAHGATVWIHSRSDAPGRERPRDAAKLSVSAQTGEGIDALWEAIAAHARDLLPPLDRPALNARQRALAECAAAALEAAALEADLLLYAEQLRSALRAFDQITGRAGVEAMLDTLFSRFCIGK